MVKDDQKDVGRIVTHDAQIIWIIHTVPIPKVLTPEIRNTSSVLFLMTLFVE